MKTSRWWYFRIDMDECPRLADIKRIVIEKITHKKIKNEYLRRIRAISKDERALRRRLSSAYLKTSKALLFTIIAILYVTVAQAETWKASAYCTCSQCCGKSDGITASGRCAQEGMVAINWLPFGTKVLINGKCYSVEDRGAKSIFGSKSNKIKRVDIYFDSHREALNFGRRAVELKIVN